MQNGIHKTKGILVLNVIKEFGCLFFNLQCCHEMYVYYFPFAIKLASARYSF
jgi:hypothetical protein